MNTKARALWIAWIICLGLGLSGCRVVYPTAVAPVPPDAASGGDAYADLSLSPPVSAVSAKGLDQTGSGQEAEAVQAGLPYYQTQNGSPAYLENFARAEACSWMGAAGQVFDIQGNPVNSMVVVVGGTINGRSVTNHGATGNAPAYGPGGYEIDLGPSVEASTQTAWIQLTNAQGQALTPQYFIDTYADCQKNLILVNFQQTLPYRMTFPFIAR
jgi:hypothetical protein